MKISKNSEKVFNLKLTGDGFNFEDEISSEKVAAVIAAVMGNTYTPDSADSHLSNFSSNLNEPPPSIREFLDEVNAIRKPHLIVAIGYFICHHEGQPDFSRDDIKARFSQAKEPMPANFARDFAQAVKDGMLAEIHQHPGRYYVTKTGITAVAKHFS